MNSVMLNHIPLDGNMVIKKGGSGGSGGNNVEKDVNFYDYDGTLLYSYTKDEFLAVNELPPLPSHYGLVCEGWNYTLDEAKETTNYYGVCDIGATHITDDGKTRFYISISSKGLLETTFKFYQSSANIVRIDWGDGSEEVTFSETSTISATHTYSKIGDYIISIWKDGVGSAYLATAPFSGSSMLYTLRHVYCGLSFYSGQSAYDECKRLKTITKGDGSAMYTYEDCYSLQFLVIPRGGNNIIRDNLCMHCYSLKGVVLPYDITKINNSAFNSCRRLERIIIPKGVSDVRSSVLVYCFLLKRAYTCVIGSCMFSNCHNINKIIGWNYETSLASEAFYNCFNLKEITLPNTITSISSYAFYYTPLVKILFPPEVNKIGNSVFNGCFQLEEVSFVSHTIIPTLGTNSDFSHCAIIVPDALYDEWIAATNWSNYAESIIKVSEYEALKKE